MDKKKIIIIIGIIMFIIGMFCGYKYYKYTHTDAYKFKMEYERLNGNRSGENGHSYRTVHIKSNNPMKYATAKDIVKKLNNKESFIVYFGFSKCPWCRSMIENLMTAAKNKNIDTIYYVDVLNIRDIKEYKDGEIITSKKGDKYYLQLIKKIDNVLENYELEREDGEKVQTGEKRIYAPNVISIANGKAEMLTDGISSKENNPYMNITKVMNNESIKKLECVLKCYLDNSNVCTKQSSC